MCKNVSCFQIVTTSEHRGGFAIPPTPPLGLIVWKSLGVLVGPHTLVSLLCTRNSNFRPVYSAETRRCRKRIENYPFTIIIRAKGQQEDRTKTNKQYALHINSRRKSCMIERRQTDRQCTCTVGLRIKDLCFET